MNDIIGYINDSVSTISNIVFVDSVFKITPTLNEYFSHKNLAEFLDDETKGNAIMEYINNKDQKFIKNILRYVINSNQEYKAKIMGKIALYCKQNNISVDVCERILYDVAQCNINDLLDCVNSIKTLQQMCTIRNKDTIHENYEWVEVDGRPTRCETISDETETAGGFATKGMIYMSYLSEDLRQKIIINGQFDYLTQYKSFVRSDSINGLFYDTINAEIYDEFLPKTQPQSIINN